MSVCEDEIFHMFMKWVIGSMDINERSDAVLAKNVEMPKGSLQKNTENESKMQGLCAKHDIL